MAKTPADLVKEAKASITEISVADAKGLTGGETVFIDVREPPEWQDGTVPGALTIPRGVLEWKSGDEQQLADKSTPIIVYCKSGGRSALAAQSLEVLGYTNVKSMAGGFEAWSKES